MEAIGKLLEALGNTIISVVEFLPLAVDFISPTGPLFSMLPTYFIPLATIMAVYFLLRAFMGGSNK